MIRNFKDLTEIAQSGELPGTVEEVLPSRLYHIHGALGEHALQLAKELPPQFEKLANKFESTNRRAEFPVPVSLDTVWSDLGPTTRSAISLFDLPTNTPVTINRYRPYGYMLFHQDIGAGSIVFYSQGNNRFDYIDERTQDGGTLRVGREVREGNYESIFPDPGDLILIDEDLWHRGSNAEEGLSEEVRHTMAVFLPKAPSSTSLR